MEGGTHQAQREELASFFWISYARVRGWNPSPANGRSARHRVIIITATEQWDGGGSDEAWRGRFVQKPCIPDEIREIVARVMDREKLTNKRWLTSVFD